MGVSAVAAVAGDTLGAVATDVIGSAITGAVVSGVTGGDPLTGAVTGGIGGGIAGSLGYDPSILGSGTSSAGSAGGTMTADQMQQAVDAYTAANYTKEQALGFIGQAAGGVDGATVESIINGGGTLNMAAQGALPAITSTGSLTGASNLIGKISPTTALTAANIGSSLLGANAAQNAAKVQAAAAQGQQQLQGQIFNTQNQQLAPARATGYGALNNIGQLNSGQYTQFDANGNPIGTGVGSGYLTNQFNNKDLNANLAPNYAFQLEQGLGGVRNLANSAGGLVSGNTLKGMQDYTQNFAGNAYQQAFGNYQGQRTNIYNTLASIAGLGQTAQGQSNNLATNYGTNTANLATGAAAAQAAGTVGAANAYGSGLQNIGNAYMLSSLLGPNQSSTIFG
jgi:hypothetical protein